MVDEEVEVTKIKAVGVLSLAGTFALISLFGSIIFAVIFALFFPLISGLLPFQLPFQISIGYLILFCIGSAVVTFILTSLCGLFYNLSSLITKGIKLYS